MGLGDGDGGIAHGAVLIAFSEAVIGGDAAELSAARGGIIDAMGEAALVDAAAVAAIFDAIDRVADATAIPLEAQKLEQMAAFMSEFAIEGFWSDREG
jgi:hypothetical protein